jgi:hypothetical protein
MPKKSTFEKLTSLVLGLKFIIYIVDYNITDSFR